MTQHDRRLHAFRPDLADARLLGAVASERFVEGRLAQVAVPVADLRGHPRPDAGLDTQLLRGDGVRVFEEREGWAWAQAAHDGYVGYVASASLAPADEAPLTHWVSVPRTFLYAEPDMKRPAVAALSLGSGVAVTDHTETRGTRYAGLSTGEWVVARHLSPEAERPGDFVGVAEALLRTPYLWGGTSAFGIDCAGLVQLALRACGRPALRDSDMQAASLGEPLDSGPHREHLRRGDLVFWRGHVGIMVDGETMIHANGHTMDVALEPLAAAVERIGYLYGGPTGFRRL